MFLKTSQNPYENTFIQQKSFNKVTALREEVKKTLVQAFSCKCYKFLRRAFLQNTSSASIDVSKEYSNAYYTPNTFLKDNVFSICRLVGSLCDWEIISFPSFSVNLEVESSPRMPVFLMCQLVGFLYNLEMISYLSFSLNLKVEMSWEIKM